MRFSRFSRGIPARVFSSCSFLFRSLKILYQRQTADERAKKATKHRNGVGFSIAHAERFTKLAESLIRNGSLSTEELEILRRPGRRALPTTENRSVKS
jgi:hypothetical protein